MVSLRTFVLTKSAESLAIGSVDSIGSDVCIGSTVPTKYFTKVFTAQITISRSFGCVDRERLHRFSWAETLAPPPPLRIGDNGI